MPGKHFDLDLDANLGGNNPNDNFIPSQKAVKTYIDNVTPTVTDTYSATSSDAMSGKAVASALSQVGGTVITFRAW